MAVVEERIAKNGARCRIMDDAYINASPSELMRRKAHANRIAHQILVQCAQERAEAAHNDDQNRR